MVSLDERVSGLEGKMGSLATKEDLAVLRADLTEQLSQHRADMIERMGQQWPESKELETRLIKWMVGSVLAGMTLAASLTVALQNLL